MRMANGTNFYRSIPPSVLSAIFPGEARWLRPYCAGGKPDKNAVAMAMRYLKVADPLYYNSLVDKHTKGYRNKPTVKSHLQKYGYLAEDGKVYPSRREQLEANRVFRTVREREAMVTQLEIKEKARLERLKRAARAGTVAFTSEGIFETKQCSICPSVYHKVPSITDPKDPCPGSCLNTTNPSHSPSSRLTTDRSAMTIAQPKEDVGVQCRRSSPVCARCGPILEPPPIVPAKSGGRADAPPKQGGFPHKDAHSKTRPKDDGTEAVNMQKAKYQVMLDEEEQALRRMIEVETQKLYKAQKDAELADAATLQQKAMLEKELEEEKERNILERKRKVALGAILTECQKRVEPQVASCASVEKEINEMKMKFEDAMRHNRILHLKPSRFSLQKTTPPKVEEVINSTIPPGKVNRATFSSASSGSLDPNLAAILPERSAESLASASSKGSSKMTSSSIMSITEHTNKIATYAVEKTAPSKSSQVTSSSPPSSRCGRVTNASPPPPPLIDPHHRKNTRVLHRELDTTLLPHVPQSMEVMPLDHTHPIEEQTTAKPKVDSAMVPRTLDGSSSPLTPRGKTAAQRERLAKSRKTPTPTTADGQDGHDISPKLKLPSVVAPHLSESSQLSVPCNSLASALSHAARLATSCPVDMYRKAEGSEPAKTPAWKSLPAIVTASSTAKELMSAQDEEGQSQVVLESKEAGKWCGVQPAVIDESNATTESAYIDKKHVIFEAQGDELQPAEGQDTSREGMDSVGASVSLPHKLQHETKETVRPPRSSLPASMPSRNSTEKVAKRRARQRRATPSTTDTSISTDEENTCGKHVAFQAQGDGVYPRVVGGSSSVPNRLYQRSKEVLPRPLRCSLPATLERSSDEDDAALPSTELGSTQLSV